MTETGYGSEFFLRACDVASACREIEGRGPVANWERLRSGSLALARFERSLPSAPVRLTASPAGQMIGEHFAIREGGRHRYRSAQAVLRVPTDFSEYMRGRRRQAVRTNVGHACRAGLKVTRIFDDAWEPGVGDTRRGLLTPGPVERWRVFGEDPTVPRLAEAILAVDDHVALLHGMVSSVRYARWLLHTTIVERLCGDCEILLVNSDAAYFLDDGQRYFQQRLGYEIARLELPRRPGAWNASRWSGLRNLTASRVVTPEPQAARSSNHS